MRIVEPPRYRTRFWQPMDWCAAATAGISALVVFLVTLAPGVTLEDAGELVTAAHSFGVPHPPGYPVWTVVAWIWIHVFPFGNIAWRTNFLSALCSAAAVGMVALLVSRSGRVMAARLISREESLEQRLPGNAAAVGAVVAGLLLAFGQAFWSQSVITEVYGMNACVLMVTLVGLYRWSFEPEQRWRLYLAAFFWGLGIATHQTQVLLGLPMAFFVWRADRDLGRGLLGLVLSVTVVAVAGMVLRREGVIHQGMFSVATIGGIGGGAAVCLFLLWRAAKAKLWGQWRVVLRIVGAVLLGLMFYLYEPMASWTNPPINWGYTRTLAGVFQNFARVQYVPVTVERTMLDGWAQLNAFLYDLQAQFGILYAVMGLAVWFFFREMTRFSRDWLWFLLVLFVSAGLGFMFLVNPSHEKLEVMSDRVFFLPSYCAYAMLTGYSLTLVLVLVLHRWVAEHPVLEWCVALALVLPVMSLVRHGAESSHRNHTFGYGYGYRMFKPEGSYPPMKTNAILFAGTASGRFVATYMVFVESQVPAETKTHLPEYPGCLVFDRRDVYVVSQDSLASPTYLRNLRAQYGKERPSNAKWWRRVFGRSALYGAEAIWLPGERDWRQALTRCLQRLRRSEEEVVVEDGRLTIRDPAILSGLNGELSRMIFERNREQHPFYVEENEVMPWMYPYLEPYGLILRLESEPVLFFDPYTVGRDRRYWDGLVEQLMDQEHFRNDATARLVYSRARVTTAAVYAHHAMFEEAEHAFWQALELCPDNPDASARFAQFYVGNNRFNEALRIVSAALVRDPYNNRLHETEMEVKNAQRVEGKLRRLEQQHAQQPSNVVIAVELIGACASRRQMKAMDTVANDLLKQGVSTADDLVRVAGFYEQMNRLDRVLDVLNTCVQRQPTHAVAWYQLAATHAQGGDCSNSITELSRALALDTGGELRASVRRDPRFDGCRKDPLFQKTTGAR